MMQYDIWDYRGYVLMSKNSQYPAVVYEKASELPCVCVCVCPPHFGVLKKEVGTK